MPVIDRVTGCPPCLEGTGHVLGIHITHLIEHLCSKGRPCAGPAVQDDIPYLNGQPMPRFVYNNR